MSGINLSRLTHSKILQRNKASAYITFGESKGFLSEGMRIVWHEFKIFHNNLDKLDFELALSRLALSVECNSLLNCPIAIM